MPGGLLAAIDSAPAPQPAPRQGGGLLAAIDAPAPTPTPRWRLPLEYANAGLHALDEGGSQLLGGLASAGAGAANRLGLLGDDTTDSINQGAGRMVREAQDATERDVPADVPLARTIAHIGGSVVPFVTPAGMLGGAAATGGNSYRGALEEGATPNEAATKGLLSAGVAAALPRVFEVAAPFAEASGGAVGGLLSKIAGAPVGSLAGRIVQSGTQGVAGGAAMGLGEAAGTALYNPDLAQERLQEIPDDALTLGALGGIHGTMEGVPAAIAEARDARATRNQQLGQGFAQKYENAVRVDAPPSAVDGPLPKDFTPWTSPEGHIQAAELERDANIRAQLKAEQDQANEIALQRMQIDENLAPEPPQPPTVDEAAGRAPDEPVGPSRADRMAAIDQRRQAVQAQYITDMRAIQAARQSGTMGKPQAFAAKQQAAAKRDAAMARIGIPESPPPEATAPPGVPVNKNPGPIHPSASAAKKPAALPLKQPSHTVTPGRSSGGARFKSAKESKAEGVTKGSAEASERSSVLHQLVKKANSKAPGSSALNPDVQKGKLQK